VQEPDSTLPERATELRGDCAFSPKQPDLSLTAFIAWDEFEKVAVANRSLVQPAFAAGRAAVSAHLVNPNRHLRESFAGITADSGFRQGITKHLTAQAPPPSPGDIVEMIAGFVPDSHGLAASGLLTIEERCDVFGKFISDICRHLSHPEWMPLYANILAWLRANSEDSITRSRRVAVLLSELNGHFKQILGLRQEILLRIRGNKLSPLAKVNQLPASKQCSRGNCTTKPACSPNWTW